MKKLLRKIEEKKKSKKTLWRILKLAKYSLWKIRYPFLNIIISIETRFYRRKLPDFIIPGIMKGGTTSLWFHLNQHPKIEMSPNFLKLRQDPDGSLREDRKEIHFFDERDKWRRGIKWYQQFFNDNDKLQGEATPNYLHNFCAHKRMFKILPKAKLIIVLRDPIKRAFSEYNQIQHSYPISKNWCYLPRKSFRENILKEIEKKFEGGIIKKGFYMEQIKNLLRYFPRKQLLIIISEQMKKNPQETYDKICDFLGIRRINIKSINYDPFMNSKRYFKKPKKKDALILYEIYKPYNEELFKFLGYEIKEWERL